MEVPDQYLDKEIYKKAKKQIDEQYKVHSAYKSMALGKLYKKMGGDYKKKEKKNQNLATWRQERWVQLLPYLKDGEVKICGTKKEAASDKYCRPSIRINDDTPMTIDELIKKHSK